jgi:hypothetical protein
MENNMRKIKAGTFQILENWEIKRVNKLTKEVIDVEKKCNTIVNNGLNLMRDLLGEASSNVPKYIGIGTGTTSPTTSDTTLEIEYTRALGTIDTATNYVVEFTKTFTFSSGVSENITEAGLFDSATVSGSTMLARTTFTSKAVSVDIDLIVTATITISRV